MTIDKRHTAFDLDKVLDITRIETQAKHSIIFKYFDAPGPEDSLILQNDHDPKPVYYQLLGQRGPNLTFNYLSKEPKDWLIRIQKNKPEPSGPKSNQLHSQQRLDEKQKNKAAFFAAREKNDNCAATDHQKKQANTQTPTDPLDNIILQYEQWPLGFLCDFIEQTDHCYFRQQAPQLDGLGEDVRHINQDTYPELARVKRYQDQLLGTLLFHLTQEKSALFDAIKNIENSVAQNQEPDAFYLKQLYTGTNLRKHANATLAKLLGHIRSHTNQYHAPAGSSEPYNYYYKRLEQFDLRLSRYLHLENTVLLPQTNKWF